MYNMYFSLWGVDLARKNLLTLEYRETFQLEFMYLKRK